METVVSEKVSSVIFDLGGVLFDIDYTLTQRAFMDMGAQKPFGELYSQQKQSGLFDDFEKGTITPADFRARLKELLPARVQDHQIDSAWNALLIGFPEKKVEILKKLGKKYRLFLLSNTNEIHLPEVMKMSAHLDANRGFEKLFEKYYYSCRMGMRKPDREIFEKVCLDNKLSPGFTLFIDDSLQNIEGARQAGLATLHYTPAISLEKYFMLAEI